MLLSVRRGLCVGRQGGASPRYLTGQPDRQPGIIRMAAVNGAHRPPDALAPLINVRRGADGDKLTPNVTKCSCH